MTDLKAKRAAFRTLHEQGCFVLPNPWDIGGVRRLEKLVRGLGLDQRGHGVGAWSRTARSRLTMC